VINGQPCTEDTCVSNNHGNCLLSNGPVSFAAEPVSISGSPSLSSDPFVVVGTKDGQVCARSLANLVPGQTLSPVKGPWRGDHCNITTAQTCSGNGDCPPGENCVAATLQCNETGQSCTNDADCSKSPAGVLQYCMFVGCIPLSVPSSGPVRPVLSSPVIGIDSTIYVTTANGLYVIK
jgi:hypothetical protein